MRLWRDLRRLGRRWEWLKVTEMTRRDMPHHHLIVGPIDGLIRCHGRTIKRGKETAVYLERMASCTCLAHVFARVWFEVTKDSFMCFATAVTDPEGAGNYLGRLGEQLAKSFPITLAEKRRPSTHKAPLLVAMSYTVSRLPQGVALLIARPLTCCVHFHFFWTFYFVPAACQR